MLTDTKDWLWGRRTVPLTKKNQRALCVQQSPITNKEINTHYCPAVRIFVYLTWYRKTPSWHYSILHLGTTLENTVHTVSVLQRILFQQQEIVLTFLLSIDTSTWDIPYPTPPHPPWCGVVDDDSRWDVLWRPCQAFFSNTVHWQQSPTGVEFDSPTLWFQYRPLQDKLTHLDCLG